MNLTTKFSRDEFVSRCDNTIGGVIWDAVKLHEAAGMKVGSMNNLHVLDRYWQFIRKDHRTSPLAMVMQGKRYHGTGLMNEIGAQLGIDPEYADALDDGIRGTFGRGTEGHPTYMLGRRIHAMIEEAANCPDMTSSVRFL